MPPLLPRKPDPTHTHHTLHGDDQDRDPPCVQLLHPVYAHTDSLQEYAFSPFCLSSTNLNLSLTSPARTLDPKNPSSAVVRRTTSNDTTTTTTTMSNNTVRHSGGEGEDARREGVLALTSITTASTTMGGSPSETGKPPSERSTIASTSTATSSPLQRTRRMLLSGGVGEKDRNPLKWICRRSDPTPQSTQHLQNHSIPSQQSSGSVSQGQLLQQHILQQLCLERLENVEKLLQENNAQQQQQQQQRETPSAVEPPPAPPTSLVREQTGEEGLLFRRVEAENTRLRETIRLLRQENKSLERMNAALSERESMLEARERVLEEQVVAAREEILATRDAVMDTQEEEEERCGQDDEHEALHERNRCLERQLGRYMELSTHVEAQRQMLVQTGALLGRAGEQNRALRKMVQVYEGKTQELERMIAVLEGEWERVISEWAERKSGEISVS